MQAAHDLLHRRVEAFSIDSDAWGGAEVNASRGVLVSFRYQRGGKVLLQCLSPKNVGDGPDGLLHKPVDEGKDNR